MALGNVILPFSLGASVEIEQRLTSVRSIIVVRGGTVTVDDPGNE